MSFFSVVYFPYNLYSLYGRDTIPVLAQDCSFDDLYAGTAVQCNKTIKDRERQARKDHECDNGHRWRSGTSSPNRIANDERTLLDDREAVAYL